MCSLLRLGGEVNNEFPGLSLNLEDSFLIVGIVTHFVESHHQKLCTNISHFDLFIYYNLYSVKNILHIDVKRK